MTTKQHYLHLAFWFSLAAASGTLSLFASITLYLSPKLPEVESLRQVKLQTPLRVFSSDGLLIGEFGEKRRNPIGIENTPKAFINALLAAEDDRFYSHPGVDIKGLLRAVSQLLQSGHIQTGGSTITMQVARNFFLTRQQTFSRKFNEILLALEIEKELSKDEILELYVNKIYLGNRAYGIEAAARVYYGQSINELSLAQLAMIAGLPKAPSAYNPIINPQRALIRRNWILGRMLRLGYIDASEHNQAVTETVSATYHGVTLELDAPYIAELARKEAVDRLGEAAYTDGFSIFTSVESRLQASAQKAIEDGLLTYDERHGYRGPEAQLPTPKPLTETESKSIPDSLPAPEDSTSTDNSPTQLTLESWQQSLRSYSRVGALRAAAITHVEPDSLGILLANGTTATIAWKDGIASARAYITENQRGPAPKAATDRFAVGDVIRVKQNPEGRWQRSQIPAAQAALVALNPEDGGIKALVGGFNFYHSHFNRATQAERQPGSNFKPFIYTAALENGLTPATMINDAPIVFDDASLESTWRPENASGKFFGPTRLRQALYKSRNLVSIRVLRSIGTQQAIKGMQRYGFDESKLPHDLSLALGSYALTPLQVATGYTVFANGGFKISPYLVQYIENVNGDIIYQSTPATVCRTSKNEDCTDEAGHQDNSSAMQEEETLSKQALADTESLEALESAMAAELGLEKELGLSETFDLPSPANPPLPVAPRVMSKQVAYLVDDILRDVIQKGTGRRARALGRHDIAGKTGTTNGPKDAWFSGYNSHIVVTTWLGFDKNYPLGRREYGGTSALPIWLDFMKTALRDIPETERELPDGLTSVRIDPATGKRARADNPKAIFEIFRTENIPDFDTDEALIIDTGSPRETLPEELF